jgi:hypothetical protein
MHDTIADLGRLGMAQDWTTPACWKYSMTCTNIPHTGMDGVPGSQHPQFIDVLHRGHATVETDGVRTAKAMGLRNLPGVFAANAAWLVIAAIVHNLLRAAGTLAGRLWAKARTATIRRDLVTLAARTAHHGRGNLVLHRPAGHHREQAWLNLWTEACGPPARAA